MENKYSGQIRSPEAELNLVNSGIVQDDDKSIPFLRRLRDMLLENKDVISFVPGYDIDGARVIGRIVVHDRISVEDHVLPRYFNHSSFASLRRQLNYFNFVRVGKGRQRESMYINDCVVLLDDILHLKRRSTSHATFFDGDVPSYDQVVPTMTPTYVMDTAKNVSDALKRRSSTGKSRPFARRRDKSKRSLVTPVDEQESTNQDEKNFVSEDELSEGRSSMVKVESNTFSTNEDAEVLAGCSALLTLASYSWK